MGNLGLGARPVAAGWVQRGRLFLGFARRRFRRGRRGARFRQTQAGARRPVCHPGRLRRRLLLHRGRGMHRGGVHLDAQRRLPRSRWLRRGVLRRRRGWMRVRREQRELHRGGVFARSRLPAARRLLGRRRSQVRRRSELHRRRMHRWPVRAPAGRCAVRCRRSVWRRGLPRGFGCQPGGVRRQTRRFQVLLDGGVRRRLRVSRVARGVRRGSRLR